MPSPYIKQLAKETGKSVGELEKFWDKAKTITKDDFNVSEDDFKDKHYAYATAIVKNLAGVKESFITVSDFIESGKSARDFIEETMTGGTVTGGDFPKLDQDQVVKPDKDEEDVLLDPDEKDKEVEKDIKGEKKVAEYVPSPEELSVGIGFITENGISIEALDGSGKIYMLNFESIKEAREQGFDIKEEDII